LTMKLINPLPWLRSRFPKKIEYIFGTIFFIFGIAFVFVTPPIYSVDESSHFYRSYQVSRFQPISTNVGSEAGGNIPADMTHFVVTVIQQHAQGFTFEDTKNIAGLTLDERKMDRVEFTNVATYPFIDYVPQAIGLRIGSIFSNSILFQLYAARLCNLIFLGICLILALRFIPRGKSALFALGLLPMTLYAGSSMSADAFVIGSVALFTAYLFRLLTQQAVITRKQWLILAGLAIAVALSKQTYIILVLGVLALGFNGKQFNWQNFLKPAGVLVAASLSMILWLVVVRNLNNDPTALQKSVGILPDPATQLGFIATHPASFAGVILETLSLDMIPLSFVGMFGVSDIPMPLWAFALSCITILLGIGYRDQAGKKVLLEKTTLLLFAIVAILNAVIILTGLYVLWANPFQPTIGMLRGRYFIPIAIFLIPIFIGRYSHTIKWHWFATANVIVLTACISTIYAHFY
jgi:uncharacterized membrane protein